MSVRLARAEIPYCPHCVVERIIAVLIRSTAGAAVVPP